MSQAEKAKVAATVDHALQAIEAAPKAFAWKARATVGDKIKWYKDVEEVK